MRRTNPSTIHFHLHYDAFEFTNGVYHVTCLTNRVPCTNSVFTRFLNSEFHVTPADGAQLDAWLEILRKIENAAPAPPPAPLLPNYASYYPGMKARYSIIAAATFTNPAAAARLSQVLHHFQRRLQP